MVEYKSRRLRSASGLPPKRPTAKQAEWTRAQNPTWRFQPWRLTHVLDACDLYDPELSEALDCPVGEVDRWEEGTAVPTDEQVAALVALTGYGARWFYIPKPPGPSRAAFTCTEDGCEVTGDTFTELWGGRWKIDRDRPDALLPTHYQPSLPI